MNYTKTKIKEVVRAALSQAGYGRGYSKDYIHCPWAADLEEEVYNDLHFKTLDEVAELASEGDEIDAYVYQMNPSKYGAEPLLENVIVYLDSEKPRMSRTSRRGDPLEVEV